MDLHYVVTLIIVAGLIAMVMANKEDKAYKAFKIKDVNIEWKNDEICLTSKHYPEQGFHKNDDFRCGIINKKE